MVSCLNGELSGVSCPVVSGPVVSGPVVSCPVTSGSYCVLLTV